MLREIDYRPRQETLIYKHGGVNSELEVSQPIQTSLIKEIT